MTGLVCAGVLYLAFVCAHVTLDNCKRVALCFDDVISSAEVVNCQGIQVQVSVTLQLYSSLVRVPHIAGIWLH